MRKSIFTFFLVAIFFTCYSQQGIIKIGVGTELNVPVSTAFKHEYKTGFGGYLKGLYGIGKSSSITFTANYSHFPQQGEPVDGYSFMLNYLSLLPGYRYTFSGFYVEPQAGFSFALSRYKTPSGREHFSTGEFMWAAGLGYEIKNIDIGVRFQSDPNNGKGYVNSGPLTNSFLNFHIGYNFLLRKGK
jgi:hypothetical protein